MLQLHRPLYSDWTYTGAVAKPAALSQSYCDEGFNHKGSCKKGVAMEEYVEYENDERTAGAVTLTN